jgi:beta-glucanase (GH16 family)
MNKTLPLCLCLGFLLSACVTAKPEPASTPSPTPIPSPASERERADPIIVWQDEFDGSELNLENWTFDLGGHGWGNQEEQVYTDRPENVRVEDGMLVIEARKEKDLIEGRKYSSARIKTQGLHAWQYGRIEARIKLPYGQGIWPAFWILGEDFSTDGWPACGEVDIMEFIGKEPDQIHATMHGPGYSGAGGIGSSLTTSAESLKNDFHVYAIEWQENEIRWYFDDQQYFRMTSEDVPDTWVFDHPFFIILNLAVGGNWPGYPDGTTAFPQFLYVDYVRVYQKP